MQLNFLLISHIDPTGDQNDVQHLSLFVNISCIFASSGTDLHKVLRTYLHTYVNIYIRKPLSTRNANLQNIHNMFVTYIYIYIYVYMLPGHGSNIAFLQQSNARPQCNLCQIMSTWQSMQCQLGRTVSLRNLWYADQAR